MCDQRCHQDATPKFKLHRSRGLLRSANSDMPGSPSYQLPDLLSLTRTFELRTNRFCRSATVASEAWLLSLKKADMHDALTEAEKTLLHTMKGGLLAAVCFPDCDLPQLRFLTDFLNMLFLSARRLQHTPNSDESGWKCGGQSETGNDHSLGHHELFQ